MLKNLFVLFLLNINIVFADTYIVRFKQEPTYSQLCFLERSGAELKQIHKNIYVSNKLLYSTLISSQEPDHSITILGYNDPYYKYQWNLKNIHADPDSLLEKVPGQKDIVVAVLDTGVAYENFKNYYKAEDLNKNSFFQGYDFINWDRHANDDHGHGTHVTSTIVAQPHNNKGVVGIAPGIKILPVKVLDRSGNGSYSSVAAGIYFASNWRSGKYKVNVINMSLGGEEDSYELYKAIQYASKRGIIIVCAAGNNPFGNLTYPAKYSEVISVGATNVRNRHTWYSSMGRQLDIVAPGGDLDADLNSDNRRDGIVENTVDYLDLSKNLYLYEAGTSMAAPHVSATVALIMGLGITRPSIIKYCLYSTTSKLKGYKYPNIMYGHGLLNTEEAVDIANQFVIGD